MSTDTAEIKLDASKQNREVHQGRGIKFVRETLNVTQKGLGDMIEENQQQISRLELRQHIEKSTMVKIAAALKVPVELIENFSPEQNAKNIISGNQQLEGGTISNTDNDVSVTNGVEIIESQNFQYQTDPKIIELYQAIIEEKNKLLLEKDLIIAQQQRLLDEKK